MPDFRVKDDILRPHLQSQVDYLYRDNIAEKLFKMYTQGSKLSEVAKACAVSEKALVIAYPSLDWGKRGKVIFFKNHLKEKEAHAKKKRKQRVIAECSLTREVDNETDNVS